MTPRAITMRLSANRAIPAQLLSDTGRKGQDRPFTAPKTLPVFSGFYNKPNKIKGRNQTTNLGVRSSNLFGRAKHLVCTARTHG